jgi:outer membrane protein assembly factor BamD (BamD/ComL family)
VQPRHAFAIALRAAAVIIVLIAAAPLVLSPDQLMRVPHYGAWNGFLLSLAAAGALLALAALINREATAPPEVRDALARINQQLIDLDVKLKDLQLMSDRTTRGSAPTPMPQIDYTPQLDHLKSAVAEVRELSLLPDADRHQRLKQHREHKKTTTLKDIYGLVAAHEWPKAERLLLGLESEYPNDSDVAKGRSYLDHSRHLFEDETLQHATATVEELMASGAWDRALQQAQLLVQGFPSSGDAHALLSRVQKEGEIYRETTAQRMFEEIRHDIDRRIWRRALMHAERLMDQFPTHRLADGIRSQMSTLRENAEIQERQELEVRIQEYIRDHRFEEAIELAEDVVRRFPLSPQADSLEKLLPRIRELAREGVESSASE